MGKEAKKEPREKEPREKEQWILHPFPAEYDADSEILILGSFPSVKSREQSFFYGHPQNRFWKVTAAVFDDAVPETIEEKRAFLHRNHLALWDVIHSCRIVGSSDQSIRDAEVNDLSGILENSKVGTRIFTNGGKAWALYHRYTEKQPGMPPAGKLPSTSPANAAWSLERLIAEWKEILGK